MKLQDYKYRPIYETENVRRSKYGQNRVDYTPCTQFPDELLNFRDQVFCVSSSTDVQRFKNFCCVVAQLISVTDILIRS